MLSCICCTGQLCRQGVCFLIVWWGVCLLCPSMYSVCKGPGAGSLRVRGGFRCWWAALVVLHEGHVRTYSLISLVIPLRKTWDAWLTAFSLHQCGHQKSYHDVERANFSWVFVGCTIVLWLWIVWGHVLWRCGRVSCGWWCNPPVWVTLLLLLYCPEVVCQIWGIG